LNETWTQVSPQHKKQVPERDFFSNPMISLPILDELKNIGFGGNEEKSVKSKELETWIHSNIGGR
jgi:hypothetical protein